MEDVYKPEVKLLHAAKMGDNNTIEQILRRDWNLVNAVDSAGRTPMHLAAQHNHFRTAQTLIAYSPNLRASDMNGKRPLQIAEERGHQEIARILREQEIHSQSSMRRELTF